MPLQLLMTAVSEASTADLVDPREQALSYTCLLTSRIS